jgi:hypothetical protein
VLTETRRLCKPELGVRFPPPPSSDTPAFENPIRGRERVLALFAVLATVFEDSVVTDELHGLGTYAMAFRLSVDGHPIQGVDHLRLDEEGLIRRITVSMRPLRALQVLAERMADTVASLT